MYFNTNEKMMEVKLSQQYEDFVYSLGAKPLTLNQYNSMLDEQGNLFSQKTSDIELATTRTTEYHFNEVYGAEDL